MHTQKLSLAGLVLALLASRAAVRAEIAVDWNSELNLAQQASGQSDGGRARADQMIRAAVAGAKTGIAAAKSSVGRAELPPADANLEAAAAQAAYSVMAVLYPRQTEALDAWLARTLAAVDASGPAIAAGQRWGNHVAQSVLASNEDAVALNPDTFAGTEARPQAAPATAAEAVPASAAIGPGRYRFTILAGDPSTRGDVDGVGAAARFDNPGGVAVDAEGNVYVSEQELCVIRRITPEGVVTTFAGVPGQRGGQDGTGAAARFNSPAGLAADGAGNVYVADTGNFTIRKITPSGAVTTVAGVAGTAGREDGPSQTARFAGPSSVAVDDAGDVFALDGQVFRRVAPDGTVTTLAATITADSAGYDYSEAHPGQICVDHAGNLYTILSNGWDYSDVVRFVPTPTGHYAGTPILPDPAIVVQPNHAYAWAEGIAVDGKGNLLISYLLNPVVVISPKGETQYRYLATDSDTFLGGELAAGANGDLVALSLNDDLEPDRAVRVGTFDPAATGPEILRDPVDRTSAVGDHVEIAVAAVGTPAPTYQWYFNALPIAGATGATLDLGAVRLSDAGQYQAVVSDRGGSVASRIATLTIVGSEHSSGGGGTGGPTGPGASSSGGGAFEAWFALAVLMLLAAAAARRRPVPAPPSRLRGGFAPVRMLSNFEAMRAVAFERKDVHHG